MNRQTLDLGFTPAGWLIGSKHVRGDLRRRMHPIVRRHEIARPGTRVRGTSSLVGPEPPAAGAGVRSV